MKENIIITRMINKANRNESKVAKTRSDVASASCGHGIAHPLVRALSNTPSEIFVVGKTFNSAATDKR